MQARCRQRIRNRKQAETQPQQQAQTQTRMQHRHGHGRKHRHGHKSRVIVASQRTPRERGETGHFGHFVRWWSRHGQRAFSLSFSLLLSCSVEHGHTHLIRQVHIIARSVAHQPTATHSRHITIPHKPLRNFSLGTSPLHPAYACLLLLLSCLLRSSPVRGGWVRSLQVVEAGGVVPALKQLVA